MIDMQWHRCNSLDFVGCRPATAAAIRKQQDTKVLGVSGHSHRSPARRLFSRSDWRDELLAKA